MLISEAQERGEIHKLLPQTHSPGVDYYLFIMETVETLLGEMETTPGFVVFPLRSVGPGLCFVVSLFTAAYLRSTSGGYFYSRV